MAKLTNKKEGTGIGSRLGMNYACTYMGSSEDTLFNHCSNRPLQFWRYVDDIWGIWTHGEKTLLKYFEIANQVHSRIKLTLRYSTDSTEFLDVKITLINGFIKTDLFTKDTDLISIPSS